MLQQNVEVNVTGVIRLTNYFHFRTQELLYLQPVHKISFISQDVSDNRAFGYIYGSPDNVHTFYAIKTEKAVS